MVKIESKDLPQITQIYESKNWESIYTNKSFKVAIWKYRLFQHRASECTKVRRDKSKDLPRIYTDYAGKSLQKDLHEF